MEKEFNLSKFIEIVDVKRIVCPKVKEHIVLKRYIKEFFKNILTPNNISKRFVEVSTIKYYAGKDLVEAKE